MAKFFDKFKQIKTKNAETPREEEKIREFYYEFDELMGVVEAGTKTMEKEGFSIENSTVASDSKEVGTTAKTTPRMEIDDGDIENEYGEQVEKARSIPEIKSREEIIVSDVADTGEGAKHRKWGTGVAGKIKRGKDCISAKITADIDTWEPDIAGGDEASKSVEKEKQTAVSGGHTKIDEEKTPSGNDITEYGSENRISEETPVLETSTDKVGLIDRQSKGYIKAKKFANKIVPKRKKIKKSKQSKASKKWSALWGTIKEKESALAHNMIHAINKIDKRNENIAQKAEVAAVEGSKHFHLAREWADINKKRILKACAGIVICALALITVHNTFTAFEYVYNGRTIGVVQEQEDVLRLVELVNKNLSKEHNAEIAIDKDRDITFNRVFAIGREIDNMEQVLKRLSYMQDMQVKGYAIAIGGQRIAIVDSEEKAQEILDDVIVAFTVVSNTVKYEKVGFAETVEIEQINTKLSQFNDKEEVLMKILTGAEKQDIYYVQPGDTFNGIAVKHGISSSDLRASNPTVIPEKLKISQEIILNVPTPLLTVQTIEVATYIEPLPYETNYQDNASIYIGENTTKIRGVNGERSVTARITKNNGIEVAKTELNAEIIKEPVTAVVLRGTKALPPKQGTGTFIYPVSGAKLSSKFGPRWGRMHYGIDLAAATGTKIRASDGGTVTFAGYSGSYGYVVKISHGGGFVTVYAHCSKMFVKVGEKVYQGQHIANVGSTGRSTGPHCHFEVQYLGVQKNPLNYL